MLSNMSKKISGLKEISNQYKNYLFDLDGVIVTQILFSGLAINKYKGQLILFDIYKKKIKISFILLTTAQEADKKLERNF